MAMNNEQFLNNFPNLCHRWMYPDHKDSGCPRNNTNRAGTSYKISDTTEEEEKRKN